MGAWDVYENRIDAHGGSKRNTVYSRAARYISSKLPDNLSYQEVTVYPSEYGYNIDSDEATQHCSTQHVAILDSDNLNEKTICSLPAEDIVLGSLIFWMNNYWLVTERDANTTLYTKGKLLQCNHLLKWITADSEIIRQWCVVEDGTKYLSGELEDRNFVVTRGDSRVQVQISKNKQTCLLDRENRFLIDDDDTPHKLSYLLTKPLKQGTTYNGEGVYKFVLQEVTATEYDNHELGIANYYKYFPKEDSGSTDESIDTSESTSTEVQDDTKQNTTETSGKKVWI